MSRIIFLVSLLLVGFIACQTGDYNVWHIAGESSDVGGGVSMWIDNSDPSDVKIRREYIWYNGIRYNNAIKGNTYYAWSAVNQNKPVCTAKRNLTDAEAFALKAILNAPNIATSTGSFRSDGTYLTLTTATYNPQGYVTIGYDTNGWPAVYSVSLSQAIFADFKIKYWHPFVQGFPSYITEIPQSCLQAELGFAAK